MYWREGHVFVDISLLYVGFSLWLSQFPTHLSCCLLPLHLTVLCCYFKAMWLVRILPQQGLHTVYFSLVVLHVLKSQYKVRLENCYMLLNQVTLSKSESEVILYFARWKLKSRGDTQQSIIRKKLCPEVQPLTLLYTIFNRKGTPKSYTFHWQKVPFSRTYLRMLHPY